MPRTNVKSPAASPVNIWHAPDVMDAVMLRGRFVDHRYPPHAHDTHCLAVITGGSLRVETPREQQTCRRGDVVVIAADTVHSGHSPAAGGWKMRVAHVQPASFAACCERLGLPQRARLAPRSHFIRDAALASDLYGVNWCSETGNDPLKRSERLLCALTSLLTRHAARPAQLADALPEPLLVRALKRRLQDDLASKLTLPALAEEFHVTPFILLRAFAREVGMTPHAFRQQARIRRAVQLLRQDKPIIAVGAETGFSDQAHFTRVFKQGIGVTPKVFSLAL